MRKTTLTVCTIIVITCCPFSFVLPTQAQESDAQKLLLDSIEKLDVPGVKIALGKGANPQWAFGTGNETSVIGALAFMSAEWQDMQVEKPEQKAVEILQMLFKAGAKLQSCDQGILYAPISNGAALFTEALLRNGASPTREIERMTPMEIAVREGRANIVELLKKYGAPALEPREALQQALIGAAFEHDIPRMEDAVDAGANVNGSNRQGETALVMACYYNFYSDETTAAVLYLLKKGADPTIQGCEYSDSHGEDKTTALHAVMYSSSVFFKKSQQKNERLKDKAARAIVVIKALLQHGAFVSARDYYGRTPLHVAAQWNNIVGAQMLIEAGCKIMPTDRKGKTPLDYAESAEMIKLLKDHGAKE